MKCPVCKTSVLIDHPLDAALASYACTQCGGQWVAATAYFRWLEAQAPKLAASAPVMRVDLPVVEHTKAKLCPQCGRILTRARVGHGVSFSLSHCGGCSGIWFDANEWEVLRGLNLHTNLHLVFSSAWQAEVAKQEREAQHDDLLRQKLGDADFAEIKRIKAWLDAHPKRAELYAVLLASVPTPPPAPHPP